MISRNSKNKTGFKGVSKAGRKYLASISINGQHVKLGSFDTPEQAHVAFLEAEKNRNSKPFIEDGISLKEKKNLKIEIHRYNQSMLEMINLNNVPVHLKSLYKIYIENVKSCEYNALTIRVNGEVIF